MRDIPVFTTENGVATLFLKNVPTTKTAYIKIQDVSELKVFLEECCDFCKAVGAEQIYASSDNAVDDNSNCQRIISMARLKDGLPKTSAQLIPVQAETMGFWRDIYNRKMMAIPNASQITQHEEKKYLASSNCYFVEKDGVQIGIGMINKNRIDVLAAVAKGAGKDVLLALCNGLQESVIELTVAEGNEKAIKLYEAMGFSTTEVLETWYQIF